ncbi:hypothetical protein [Amycolatopsis taiwanensis]|uniref:hypothetical protein n=1 Tax=Amycolatopsis taiwanensis TaxID=342230 RepID=UPI0004862523|nr:hypothetical protein [Amycolatopsis taiwanensis]
MAGARGQVANGDARADFGAERAALLFERYGTRAAEVAAFLRAELERDPHAERPDLGVGARLTRDSVLHRPARRRTGSTTSSTAAQTSPSPAS